jgi:hypothetical protein
MAKVSRHTLRFWEEAAVSLLCDLTDQVPIPGSAGTVCEDLRMSKLGREEAHRMIGELLEALGIDRVQSLHCLADAWRARRDAKAARYGWYPDEQAKKRVKVKRPAAPRRRAGPQWVQATLF